MLGKVDYHTRWNFNFSAHVERSNPPVFWKLEFPQIRWFSGDFDAKCWNVNSSNCSYHSFSNGDSLGTFLYV